MKRGRGRGKEGCSNDGVKLTHKGNDNDGKEIEEGSEGDTRGKKDIEKGRQCQLLFNSVSFLSADVTPEETVGQLMTNCTDKLSQYDKLFFEFGVVLSNNSVNKAGEARVRAAAVEVTREGLRLVRYCTLNLAKLSTASLEKAVKTVLNCKSQRDFAKDSCPELQFSCRQLMGAFQM